MKQREVNDRAHARREEIARRVLDENETGAAVARSMGLSRTHVNVTATRMLARRQIRDHVIAYYRNRRIQRRSAYNV